MSIVSIVSHIKRQPKALYVLLSAEVPELMGRFGIMATLVLYLKVSLHMSDTQAVSIYGTYLMMSYITPILGGYLADCFLGYRRAVILGAVLMIAGDVCLVIPELTAIEVGLSLIIVGIGFFSPSLIALVNALYADKDEGRDQAFVLYYIARNIGALISPTVCGILGVAYGYHVAFIFTGLSMAIGLVIFMAGLGVLPVQTMREYQSITHRHYLNGLLSWLKSSPIAAHLVIAIVLVPVIICAFVFHLGTIFLMVGLVVSIAVFYTLFRHASMKQTVSLIIILLSIVTIMIFMSVDQLCGATFNLFVDRLIDRHLFGWLLPTSVFFSINPLFMIVFGGFIMVLVNRIRRPNETVAAFTKYSLAYCFFAVAMCVFVIAAQRAVISGHASGWYVVVSYSLCALAELCVIPIVIASIGRLAPVGQVGLMMGLYQFGDAIASYVTGKIAGWGSIDFPMTSLAALHRAALIYRHVFFSLALLMFIIALVLLVLRKVVALLLASSMDRA